MRSAGSFPPATAVVLVFIVSATYAAQAQTFTVLHTFKGGRDGGYPTAGLIRDRSRNLYGTTAGTGAPDYGTVFKLNKSGKEYVLYRFKGTGGDGGFPFAALVRDVKGNLYGTTPGDGSFGAGTVFKVDSSGKERVLYNFTGGPDGALPYGNVIRDPNGTLYGTTESGGSSSTYGTVFKLKAGTETVLYRFAGGTLGEYPFAGLVRDDAGNLYGTTAGDGATVYGTVFELDKAGKETLLHSFMGGTDGQFPIASLILDSAGNLYGTTRAGGAFNCGTVFKVDKTGQETLLYSFSGMPDGKWPYGGLLLDSTGTLYGTTALGGTSDNGTVFKLDTSGKETVLYSLNGATDGGFPRGGLVRDARGNLYGTTSQGGATNFGTVFRLRP